MEKRKIKSLTIEYENGDIETFNGTQTIYHIVRKNYEKGATKPEHGFLEHQIGWSEPHPQRV